MSNKRKRDEHTSSTVSFHHDFHEPTDEDREEALGSFPFTEGRPSALIETFPLSSASVDDLNVPFLYQPTSQTNRSIPPPRDELDWLAQVPEEGQTFPDYVRFQTSRSGRLRPIANASSITICLLPILGPEDEAQWPHDKRLAPRLESLVEVTQAFFARPVRLLPPALVTRNGGADANSKRPGAFAAKTQYSLKIRDGPNGGCCFEGKLRGRFDSKTGRSQLQTASLLDQLATFRSSYFPEENFCIMGITVQDLYDGPKDLFCAGFAFGGSKVAAFSFHRYHPAIRMSPLHWWDYGYQKTASNYSYFEEGKKPKGISSSPPNISSRGQVEYLRRSCKLLLHEHLHLYGFGHCIHHKCLMMGTGHLVEDFDAPFHLCGICLRKLQWRLGFDVETRYREMASVLKDKTVGLTNEAAWLERQIRSIQKKRKEANSSDP